MSGSTHGTAASPFKQPKAVFAVAFACVVSFMGIGLVDPILPAMDALTSQRDRQRDRIGPSRPLAPASQPS